MRTQEEEEPLTLPLGRIRFAGDGPASMSGKYDLTRARGVCVVSCTTSTVAYCVVYLLQIFQD
jgi:hypothetical protein